MNKFILTLGILFSIQFTQSQEGISQIDLENEDFSEFEVFGNQLDDYKVYFTGENHTYATFNTEFQFKLLTYLYKEQNVRHFIFEQSPAVGYIIENVIIEDKDSYLNYLSEMFYTPFYELVKNVRDFNHDLPDSAKIHMHGIDIERFPTFSVYALERIVDTLPHNFDGGQVFEQIKALHSSEYQYAPARAYYAENDGFNFQFGEVSAWESLKSIISISNEYRDTLGAVLGKDSATYYSILESLETGREWYVSEKRGDVKSPIIRERFMVKEFSRFYDAQSEEKYYGQFGRCHLHRDQKEGRCYDYYMNSVANRINEMEPSIENKVLVIPIFYYESKEYDREIIEDLSISEEYLNNGETYIFDLSKMGASNEIRGFFDDLPFVIISNAKDDRFVELEPYWASTVEEFHLGGYYGYQYYNKLDDVNFQLNSIGQNGFTNKFLTYSVAADYFVLRDMGSRYFFRYIPEVSNGQRFSMRGYQVGFGGYYPFGNRWIMAAIGYDIVFGGMKLIEESEDAMPNLIQSDGVDKVVYRNDIFVLDPNFEMRLTFPVLSFNLKAGYNLDVSGKYWKLDQKVKSFPKTSFSGAYIQVGASLNFKKLD